jgi:hypothetical protein
MIEVAQDGLHDVAHLLASGEQALSSAGNLSAARRYFDEAARRSEAVRDIPSLGRAALGLGGIWVHENRGAADAARIGEWQRRALDGLDPETDLARRLRIRVLAEAEYRAGSASRIIEAVDDVREYGDSVALAEALSLAHHCMLGPEYAAMRLRLAEELLALGTTVGRPLDALLGLLWRTVDLLLVGDPHAGRSMNELRTLSEKCDHAAVAFVVNAIDVMLAVRGGELRRAEGLAENCRDQGVAVGDADALGWYGAHLSAIHWYESRSAELVPLLAAVAYSPTLAEPNDAYFAALAVAAADAGDLTEASGALRRLRRDGLGSLRSSSTWLVSMLGAAEAALLVEDADTATETYELLLPYADLPVMASLAVVCFGSAHYPLAAAALTRGDVDLAAEHLRAAVGANEALGNWPAHRLASLRMETVLQRRDSFRCVPPPSGPVVLRRAGRHWSLALGVHTATVNDSVGMRYLAALLARPGVEITAADLAGSALSAPTAQPVLDPAAKQAYRRRLDRLRTEIDSADDARDEAGAMRARAEYQQIVAELRQASGLGGRDREFADSGERARTAVQKAIRRAVARIEAVDPVIGRELADTVVTGRLCCYLPRIAQS